MTWRRCAGFFALGICLGGITDMIVRHYYPCPSTLPGAEDKGRPSKEPPVSNPREKEPQP